MWHDKSIGEDIESYTLLTINADAHPWMSRMHRPDPARPPHLQHKRSVVPIELEEVDQWLFGTVDEARSLLRMPEADAFAAKPTLPPVRGKSTRSPAGAE